MKERIYYWDNLKTFLIFLVVLGHFLLPVYREEGKLMTFVYQFIYLFHMPAFVLVSGFLSKNYVRKTQRERNQKLFGYLILFLIFSVLLWLLDCLMMGEPSPFSLLETSSAQWYMLAMFFWLLFIPVLAVYNKYFVLFLTVLISLLAGYSGGIGNFLALSRTIVFLPFFVFGYFLDGERLLKKFSPKMKWLSASAMLALAAFMWINQPFVRKCSRAFYGKDAYEIYTMPPWQAMLLRLAWYLVSTLAVLAVMSLIPQRQTIWSYIGERTLSVYILHRMVRAVFKYYDWYRFFNWNQYVLLVSCIVISLLLVILLSEKHLYHLFSWPFKLKIPERLLDESRL